MSTVREPGLEYERLLTPGQAGRILNVEPKTVTRWANDGLVPSVVLPRGHHRFRESDIRRMAEPKGGRS